MGKVDEVTKEYMEDPARFADVFNYAVYGGEAVIRPESLECLDSSETSSDHKAGRAGRRQRDELKVWSSMRDGNATYAILGIENQTSVHYAMPVRIMLYDALRYVNQLRVVKNRSGKKRQSKAEFLSGIGKDERVSPVVTVVLHFGAETWDGPTSIHQMVDAPDERLLSFVPNYDIKIISPATMGEDDFEKFETNLGLVLRYIRYSKDKDRLAQLVESDKRYRSLDGESARLLNTVTDSRLAIGEDEETVDMCQAIEEMRRESLEQGLEQGIEQGLERGTIATLASLVSKGRITLAEAAEEAGMPEREFGRRIRELGF